MVNLGTAIAYLDLDSSPLLNGLHSAMGQLNVFASGTASTADRLTALGSAATAAGKTMSIAVTLPLAAIGTAAVKTAADFEATMSKVQSLSLATGDDMLTLSDKAKQIGAATKFSSKEAAEAFTYMASAGWSTQSMLEGIDGIMALSASDGLDLASTADIVTGAIAGFGLQASDSAHVADVLAMTASASTTNLQQLGESFKYVGSVAGTCGYSVESVSFALGLMANQSIQGSQAGTTLRAALLKLNTATQETTVSNTAAVTSSLNKELKAYQKSLGDREEKVKDSYEAQEKTVKNAIDIENELFQKAYNFKIKLINDEYTEKIKLVDEERYNRIKAIDGEIEKLNAKTDAENKAVEEKQQKEKLATLQQAVIDAKTDEERKAAQKELDVYQEELRLARTQAERQSKIDSYESEKKQIDEKADKDIEKLKESQDTALKRADTVYEYESKLLKEFQEKKLENFNEEKEQAIKKIKERNDAELDAFRELQDQKRAAAQAAAVQTPSLAGDIPDLKVQLDELRESYKSLSETEKLAKAKDQFGLEAASGMLAIINTSDEAYQQMADSIWNADGAAKQMSDILMNNTKGSVEQFTSSVEGLSLSFGEILLPIVRSAVDGLTSFTNMISSSSEETKKMVLIIGGIAAALGPVLIILGTLATNLGSLMKIGPEIMTFLKTGTGLIGGISAPVVAVAAAIAAVIASLVYLYNTNEDFRKQADELIEKIKVFGAVFMQVLEPAIQPVKEALGKLWEALQPLIEFIGNTVLTVINELINLFIDLLPALDPIMAVVGNIIDVVTGLVDVIVGLLTLDFAKVGEGFSEIWNSLTKAGENAIESVKQLFDGLGKFIGEKIKGMIGADAFSKLTESFGPIKEKFDEIFDTLKTTFGEVFGGLGGNGSEIFGELVTGIQEFWEGTLKPVIEAAWEWFQETWTALQPFIQGILDAIGPLIKNIGLAFENVGEVVAAVVDLLKGDFSGFGEHVSNIVGNIKQIFSNTWDAIKSIFSGWVETSKQIFSNLIDKWLESFDSFKTMIAEKWNNSIEEQKEKIENMKQLFVKLFTESIPKLIDDFVTWLAGLPAKIGEVITGILTKIVEFTEKQKQHWEDFKILISAVPTFIADKFTELITNLVTWFTELPGKIMEAFNNLITALATWFPTFVVDLGTWFTTVIDFFKTLPEKWKEQAKLMFTAFWDGLKAVGDSIKEWFTGWIDDLLAGVTKVIDGLSKVKDTITGQSSKGSYASGLDYVPYDGYVATLHRGEAIVTAEENSGSANSSNVFNMNVYSNPRAGLYDMKRAAMDLLELGGIL